MQAVPAKPPRAASISLDAQPSNSPSSSLPLQDGASPTTPTTAPLVFSKGGGAAPKSPVRESPAANDLAPQALPPSPVAVSRSPLPAEFVANDSDNVKPTMESQLHSSPVTTVDIVGESPEGEAAASVTSSEPAAQPEEIPKSVTTAASPAAPPTASPAPGPVFKPRTSSLHPTPTSVISPSPPRSAPPPAHEPDEHTPWSTFLKSRATVMGMVAAFVRDDDDEFDDGSWENVAYPGVAGSSSRTPARQEPLLSDLDPESQEFLLTRLNMENQALALNPKTIYVEDGSVRGHGPTLSALTNDYSTKAPGADDSDAGDTDFWTSVLDDYPSMSRKMPHLLTARVRAGVPPHLRSRMWAAMAGADEKRFLAVYPLLQSQESLFERIIRRDIPRTYPKIDMFMEEGGEGQEKLYRVLKAYSVYDAEVGYCQGLSFVVGPLLMQDMSETQAFALLVRLLEDTPPPPKAGSPGPHPPLRSYGLRSLFEPTMTGLHRMLHQHTELVRSHLPRLHHHLQSRGITATMYASQWFLTLFTYNVFPLPTVFRIWDVVIEEGAVETLLRLSLGILRRVQARSLEQDEFEDVLESLKGEQIWDLYRDQPDDVVRDIVAEHDLVSEKVLRDLSDRYSVEKRAKPVSETEIVGLQALIRQLRLQTSRSDSTIVDLEEEKRELTRRLDEKSDECERLREEVEKLRRE
ncbi:hypothetical protein HKX48_001950, partial [Thoreauomyces humboldtii]